MFEAVIDAIRSQLNHTNRRPEMSCLPAHRTTFWYSASPAFTCPPHATVSLPRSSENKTCPNACGRLNNKLTQQPSRISPASQDKVPCSAPGYVTKSVKLILCTNAKNLLNRGTM